MAEDDINRRPADPFDLPTWLRRSGEKVEADLDANPDRVAATSPFLMRMMAQGAKTMGNWLGSTRPTQVGPNHYEVYATQYPQDILAPLGAAGMTSALGAVPKNAIGVFGGKLAKTADHAALARAEEMAAKGADRKAIWDETGWFQGQDGKWRFEIPDDQGSKVYYWPGALDARVKEQSGKTLNEIRETGVQAPLSEVLEHPQVYDAYSALAMTPWKAVPPSKMTEPAGGYWSGQLDGMTINNTISPSLSRGKSITLHELQHGIQDIEGFAKGSNPKRFQEDAKNIAGGQRQLAEVIDAQLIKREAESTGKTPDEVLAMWRDLNPNTGAANWFHHPSEKLAEFEQILRRRLDDAKDPDAAYRKTTGEVEARNVQTRMDMTPAERRAKPPWETEDIPTAQQVLRDYPVRADQQRASMPGVVASALDQRPEDILARARNNYANVRAQETPGALPVPSYPEAQRMPVPTRDRMPTLSEALRSYPPRAAEGLSLSPPIQLRDDGSFGYLLYRDGKYIGDMTGRVDGSKAHIGWIGSKKQELGVGGLRQLREQMRADFPEVTIFEGHRVSGARKHGDDKLQSVTMLADQAKGSMPGIVAGAAEQARANTIKGALDVRPMSKRSLYDIADATYLTPYRIDPVEHVPIGSLTGQYHRPERVAPLMDEIRANRWIEPLVVDRDGNVIEGQHRLRALQGLGVDSVPVHRIRETMTPEQMSPIVDAARAHGVHREQAQQIAKQIADIIDDEGVGALGEYVAPRGFEKPWGAAVKAAQSRSRSDIDLLPPD